jgi:hypothetical protein
MVIRLQKKKEFIQFNWLKEAKSMLIWKKDKDGKDQLLYPN